MTHLLNENMDLLNYTYYQIMTPKTPILTPLLIKHDRSTEEKYELISVTRISHNFQTLIGV